MITLLHSFDASLGCCGVLGSTWSFFLPLTPAKVHRDSHHWERGERPRVQCQLKVRLAKGARCWLAGSKSIYICLILWHFVKCPVAPAHMRGHLIIKRRMWSCAREQPLRLCEGKFTVLSVFARTSFVIREWHGSQPLSPYKRLAWRLYHCSTESMFWDTTLSYYVGRNLFSYIGFGGWRFSLKK